MKGSNKKLSLSIVGGGNVAFHLMNVFYNNDKIQVKQLCNRSCFTSHFEQFAVEKITNVSFLEPVDICIIAVKDSAIFEVSEKLPFSGNLVVHTSGNTDIDVLSSKNRKGVFYPLQSFSKEVSIDFQKVPICIEAQNSSDLKILRLLAEFITSEVYEINSFQRKILHISAVMMNNFTNHLIAISKEICEENKIPFEILKPLLTETFEKIQKTEPFEAQTGPARRNDRQTIENHLAILSGNRKEIYKTITNSILERYGSKKL
ncbi:Rossmann-like and DUF2520 domain-containing protein [Capnocytophaga felis]|uniref:DUF2520 domain-containing protein n=1 Tax=Capnocytophaga felis TaxID=2267611 RepID=A0A5M4BBN9_9FLAO|nr:DUF2520 domain-containing protein [Capnocytophaga felis]GET46840.1 hypothetical protein RCZ01_21420 [Capnocytophaga felis]GET48542.1 hypothetical protein RCZ02_13730 [Capnocytophaga felis]